MGRCGGRNWSGPAWLALALALAGAGTPGVRAQPEAVSVELGGGLSAAVDPAARMQLESLLTAGEVPDLIDALAGVFLAHARDDAAALAALRAYAERLAPARAAEIAEAARLARPGPPAGPAPRPADAVASAVGGQAPGDEQAAGDGEAAGAAWLEALRTEAEPSDPLAAIAQAEAPPDHGDPLRARQRRPELQGRERGGGDPTGFGDTDRMDARAGFAGSVGGGRFGSTGGAVGGGGITLSLPGDAGGGFLQSDAGAGPLDDSNDFLNLIADLLGVALDDAGGNASGSDVPSGGAGDGSSTPLAELAQDILDTLLPPNTGAASPVMP